jgi:hypothetical protein
MGNPRDSGRSRADTEIEREIRRGRTFALDDTERPFTIDVTRNALSGVVEQLTRSKKRETGGDT